MNERIIYFAADDFQPAEYANLETGRWYKQGASPLTVRVVAPGARLHPMPSVVADSYADAFQQLYGHPMPMPVLQQTHRREGPSNA